MTHINELMTQGVITCYEVRGWAGFHEEIPKGVKRAYTRGMKEEHRWNKGVGSFIFPLVDIDKYENSASVQEFDFMRAGPLPLSEQKAFKKQESKIVEIEAQLAEAQRLLTAKDAHITELEKELAAVKAKLESGKSLAGVVCRMRQEGKSDEEIAAHLHDDGKWCTQAQVGALLHADENRIASDSMQQRARRLLGRA